MKEIKFRAWDKTFGDMEMDVQGVSSNRIIGTSACESLQEVIDSWEFIVMQYSGVKDEKGVEIYEGDVLECKTHFGQYKAVVCLGEYNQDGSGDEYPPTKCIGFYVDKTKAIQTERDRHSFNDTTSIIDSEFSWIRVIGNVHQNPELLALKEDE